MRLAIIMPALNEQLTVGDVVRDCQKATRDSGLEVRTIVVDDGSTDATAEVARAAGAHVVRHSVNSGVGRALRTGLGESLRGGADIIVNIDADGQFDPSYIPELIRPIVEGEADFTTASRFLDPRLVPDMPRIKIWGNRGMSRIISYIARQRFSDVSCGFRAYSRDAALQLNLWGDFTYTQESILNGCVRGLRIVEVPLPVRGERRYGESRVASNLVSYGFRTMRIILQTFCDFWPLHFFGLLATSFLAPGVCLLVFFAWHRLTTGRFSPHIWAGFTGGTFVLTALLLSVTGIFAEMVKRVRLNQEELLYYHKKIDYSSIPPDLRNEVE